MITKSDFVEDILWLIELTSPNITSYPHIDVIKSSKFIDKKSISTLSICKLFKTVTTIAFYFEIKKTSLSLQRSGFCQTLDEGEDEYMEKSSSFKQHCIESSELECLVLHSVIC